MFYSTFKTYVAGKYCRRCINRYCHMDLTPEHCRYQLYPGKCRCCGEMRNMVTGLTLAGKAQLPMINLPFGWSR